MKACQKARTRRESSQEGSSFAPTLDALRRQYSYRTRRQADDQDGQSLQG